MSKKNLEVKYLPVADLLPYARNARTHSDEQIAQIAGSIKEFGFVNPILISKGNDIIAGHGRALAAAKLGMESVPTIALGHLTDIQRRAYVLADNRIALSSGWDDQMLKLETLQLMDDGFDISLLGFSKGEIDFEDYEEPDEKKEPELKEPEISKCPNCGVVLANG